MSFAADAAPGARAGVALVVLHCEADAKGETVLPVERSWDELVVQW